MMSVDAPVSGATVLPPFLVGGWALDLSASGGSGIDAVHVWAAPVSGSPVFLGAAEMNVTRPDVAAVYGAQFQQSGFNVVATTALSPGAYVLYVYARRQSTGSFDIVGQVAVTLRGVTLSDLVPCAADQVPRFDGAQWGCATSPGTQGPAGPTGPTGPQGIQGPQGPTGAAGTTGSVGTTGSMGPPGPTGGTGAPGMTGTTGPVGPTGPAVATGATCPTAPTGPPGATGATGLI